VSRLQDVDHLLKIYDDNRTYPFTVSRSDSRAFFSKISLSMVTPQSHSRRTLNSGSSHMVGRFSVLTMVTSELFVLHLRPNITETVSDLAAIHDAIVAARAETGKPTIICLRTTIGYGSKQQGTHGVHGSREYFLVYWCPANIHYPQL
jgi:Transketolase, thiamine diphosphate binding domain